MPSLSVAKYMKMGGLVKFASPHEQSRKLKLTFQFDELEPVKMEYTDLVLPGSKSIGMRMSIGALMKILEDFVGAYVFDYGIPRDSLEWHVAIDDLASKYSITISPDRELYEGSLSFNREGVNIIFQQPNNIDYVPTEFSSHFEYIESDNALNYNVKTTVNAIERQLSGSIASNQRIFEFENQLVLHPDSIPISTTLRITPYDATVIFGRFSSEELTVESTTQFNANANRYSVEMKNKITRGAVHENYNFEAEYNINTNIAELTMKIPSMAKAEKTQLDFNRAIEAFQRLFSETGLDSHVGQILPRIGREQTENKLVYFIGFGRDENNYVDVVLTVSRGFEQENQDRRAAIFAALEFSGLSRALTMESLYNSRTT